MKLPKFDYAVPATLPEAIALLDATEGARPLAGGQSLIPLLAYRMAAPTLLVDLRRVPDLEQIYIGEDGTRIGARVRWCDIEASAALRTAQPLLVEAIRHVAHHQIRTRGTVGGSLAHADPAAELPGVALACAAEIVVVHRTGTSVISARSFFRAALETALPPGTLITELRLPPWPAGRFWGFEEFARRRGDFAIAGVALHVDRTDGEVADAGIAAIGVGPTPMRLSTAEAALRGRRLDRAAIRACCDAAQQDIAPEDDLHGSAAYRRALISQLIERILGRALQGEAH